MDIAREKNLSWLTSLRYTEVKIPFQLLTVLKMEAAKIANDFLLAKAN